jgi:hypothetical protein
VLLDDREARAVTIAWAVSVYPAVVTRTVTVVEVMESLGDSFEPDESVVVRMLCELCGGPEATIEVPLVRRIIAERRYGQRLYQEVFARAPEFWKGSAALDMVRSRASRLPDDGVTIVVSPRSRLELMIGLLRTGWSSKLTSVVSADDVASSMPLADELLSEGARRLASHTGPSASVNLLTKSRALRRAGEARGFLLA